MSRNRQPVANIEPTCIECGKLAVLVTGKEVYPGRPDLHDKPMFKCSCGAYVGCHPGTEIPLGYPAGRETRRAREAAHEAFDRLWKRKAQRDKMAAGKARGLGYKWLGEMLGIAPADCHISHMNADTCRRVVELCRPKRTAQ